MMCLQKSNKLLFNMISVYNRFLTYFNIDNIIGHRKT